jgi:hypothetical protein
VRTNEERSLNTVTRTAAALVALGLVGYACAAGVQNDDPGGTPDAGAETAAADPPDGGTACGNASEPCCDAGCIEDGSFCSANKRCMSAHPTDMGDPCASGDNCQSGLCTYLQAYDAGSGASPPSPTVCSGPCWEATDCLPGWACEQQSMGPIVSGSMGPGTCVCTPVAETCDGKDDNCDGVIDEEPGASASCTTTLGTPSECIDAGCVCSETCDGGCVNLAGDPNNCGACGKACLPGLQFCSSSQCVCSGALCPIPDGGLGDAGYIVPDGGPDGSPIACVNTSLDPSNCGGCGIACPYTCASGCVPTMLATLWSDADAAASTGYPPAGAVVSTGSEVLILTAANGGVIQECSVTGCNQNPVTIVATGLDNANNTGSAGLLALGGSWAYWPGQAAVKDVTSADPTVSVFAQPTNASVYAVATNATRVFWSDVNLGISSCAFGATCASPSTLVPKASLAAAPQVLAADESYVYWMDTNGNVLSSVVAGGSPVTLEGGNPAAGGGGYPIAIVASAGRAYYVDAASGQLMTATGGAASSSTVYSTDQPTAFATDGVNLYWGGSNGIMKCALGASCATPTEIYGATVTALAADANNIYWIDDGTNNSQVPNVWEYHK